MRLYRYFTYAISVPDLKILQNVNCVINKVNKNKTYETLQKIIFEAKLIILLNNICFQK